MSLTEHLLRGLSPSRPLITHYDDAAGTRVELSVATVTNWAAKTANWLVEEFDVEPGDAVAVRLPAHWQTAGVLLGAWWCGAQVVSQADDARVTFVGPGSLVSGVTAVVALDPMGRGLASPPPDGALDYLAEARSAGDDFSPLTPISGDTPALAGSTVDEVLARVDTVEPGARVLSTVEWTVPDGVLHGFVSPLAAGAHLVQVSNPDPAKLADHRRAERTTADL
ncbi:TIGR03089 family protein [Amycolatopsis alkalitolerans]|uniref:TIGR03089 family protein n=1 Tax=Amycolatopsis alkalitolerans TaxID=2547244 RepID=A0A5C4LRS6_9PSEU|nr:TIGR03089 family protein [Amycolatopsis alkalitolerans]TNC20829.1 TIGR03089 family protein [Amycolatopsis alkalitolerans]